MDKYTHKNSSSFDWSYGNSDDNNSEIYGTTYYIIDTNIVADMQLKDKDNLWYKLGPIPNTDNTVYKWQNVISRKTADIHISKFTPFVILYNAFDLKRQLYEDSKKKIVVSSNE